MNPKIDLTIQFFDAIAYLDDKGIPHTHEGPNTTPGWENVDCPWCGDTMKHLGINLETNVLNCWRCGTHNIVHLIEYYEGNEWAGALAVMEQFQNYSRPEKFPVPGWIPAQEVKIPKEFRPINAGGVVSSQVHNFLAERGVNLSIAIEHKTLYSGMAIPKHNYRLLFPVYIHQRLVTYMTRSYSKLAKQPYRACDPKDEVIPIKHTLYGYDDITPGSIIVLVEGLFDQWKLGRGSLAMWGAGWSMEQVTLLRSLYPKKVYTLFDSEEEAQERAKKLSKAIWFADSEVLYLDDRKDPGELSMEEGRKVMGELK